MKSTIRIIGGQFRGKKLTFPEIQGLRPTPDRVRETLFNWLMQDIHDARCLDAFAGSGALGLEAFSRGAGSVTFIEQDNLAFSALKKTISQFNSPALNIFNRNTLDYLKQCRETFDIIFLDPPFHSDMLERCLKLLEDAQCLAPEGLVYAESAQPICLEEGPWKELKCKRAGQVIYGLYQRR